MYATINSRTSFASTCWETLLSRTRLSLELLEDIVEKFAYKIARVGWEAFNDQIDGQGGDSGMTNRKEKPLLKIGTKIAEATGCDGQEGGPVTSFGKDLCK